MIAAVLEEAAAFVFPPFHMKRFAPLFAGALLSVSAGLLFLPALGLALMTVPTAGGPWPTYQQADTDAEPVAVMPPPGGAQVSPLAKLVIDHLFELLVTSLLPAAFLWIRAHTKGAGLDHAIDVFEQIVTSKIATLRPKIAEALADGVLSPDEKAAITAEVVSSLPVSVVKTAQASFGDGFMGWVGGLVVQAVTDQQRKIAEAAGAVAAAKVANVDDALAAARVRHASVPEAGL